MMRLDLWQDVRHAVRLLRRSPVFTVASLVTLTLGIGAATAAFAVVDALLLRDVAAPEPHRLVKVSTSTPSSSDVGLPFQVFRELSARDSPFSAVVATWGAAILNVETVRGFTPGSVVAVTASFFEELGVRPVAGHLLTSREVNLATLAPESVAVLGHGFWQQQYGGDPQAVGTTIRINGAPFVVTGIAPQGFTGFNHIFEPEVMIPLTALPVVFGGSPASLVTDGTRVDVVGRLKPGTVLEAARAQLAVMWPDLLALSMPGTLAGQRRDDYLAAPVIVTSAARGFPLNFRERFSESVRGVAGMAWLLAIVAAVGLAGLSLARASARDRDIATRIALGATGRRLVQHVALEGVLLSGVGVVCGLAFAWWSSRAVSAFMLQDTLRPTMLDIRVDAPVITFAIGLAVAFGLLFSLTPLLRIRGVFRSQLLSARSAVRGSGRPGRLLVAGQVALSVTLLAGGGLLLKSVQELRSLDPGIDPADVVVAELFPRGVYGNARNSPYYRDVLDRVRALPGVSTASFSHHRPGTGYVYREPVAEAGSPTDEGSGIPSLANAVSPGFFDTLRLALREGRDFDWRDSFDTRRVAIISESLARRLFPEGSAVGRHVRSGNSPARSEMEVVGVAADARLGDVRDERLFAVYTPLLQRGTGAFNRSLVVRGTGASAAAIDQVLASFGIEYPMRTETLDYIAGRTIVGDRLAALLAGFFGALALLVAAVGLYGHLAYMVTTRTKEIGIRTALGATAGRVVAVVTCEALAIVLAGMLVGLAGVVAVGRLMQSLLFGVSPYDPIVPTVVLLALLLMAALTCAVPAWRATRVDPAATLRAE